MLLSIGSLGKDNSTAIVTKVVVDTAILRETANGLRIKTWQVFKLFIGDIFLYFSFLTHLSYGYIVNAFSHITRTHCLL